MSENETSAPSHSKGTEWRTMPEWRANGPENGKQMLVLLSDGTRHVASFNGYTVHWEVTGDTGMWSTNAVVAWAEIPEVPAALVRRQKSIASHRRQLDELAEAELECDELTDKAAASTPPA